MFPHLARLTPNILSLIEAQIPTGTQVRFLATPPPTLLARFVACVACLSPPDACACLAWIVIGPLVALRPTSSR